MRKASTRMLEQGTQRRPLLQTSSPLKTNNETQPETLIRIGTTNGGTSLTRCFRFDSPQQLLSVSPVMRHQRHDIRDAVGCATRPTLQTERVPTNGKLTANHAMSGPGAAASYVMIECQTSERHACRLMGLARSTQRYRRRRPERDAALRARLKELAGKRMRFGYRRLTAMLVRERVEVNHKRVYRLYREEGLAMRIRQRRRIRWNGTAANPAAVRPNQRWSIDFVSGL